MSQYTFKNRIHTLASILCFAGLNVLAQAQSTHTKIAEERAVAFVRNVPIMAGALELRQWELTQSAAGQQRQGRDDRPDAGAVRSNALKQLIEEAVLLNAAPGEGVAISEAEVVGAIQVMQSSAQTSDDPQVQTAFSSAAQNFGIAVEDFATDPRVIAAYRKMFVLSAMRGRLAESIPPEQRDYASVQAAVDQFVADRSRWVKTEVPADYNPQ